MKKISPITVRTLIAGSLIGALLVLGIAFSVYAGDPDYILSWWTVDGGGGLSQAGNYTLVGTIGQFDASAMSGGGFSLYSGFWPGGALLEQVKLYLPLVVQ